MTETTLLTGDCVEQMRTLPAESVDAVVCDPPYLLGFMGKDFDQQGGAHLDPEQMQTWHKAWAVEALRVLKPGGHLLAFGGTRTFHRLASGIEDAGFEVRDTLAWLYGSGSPKSRNIGCRCAELQSHSDGESAMHELRNGVSDATSVAETDEASSVFGSLQGDPERSDMGEARTQGSEGTHGRKPSAGGRENARSEEPSVEGRGDVQALKGQLRERSLREGSGVGASDGTQGRLRDGAQARDGNDGGASVVADGGRSPQGSRSATQRAEQLGTLAHERGSQKVGGWPLCERCGLPVDALGTALKPAFEPIVVARKPLVSTVAANVLAHGTGALNINGCRVAFSSDEDEDEAKTKNADFGTPAGGNEVYGDFSMVERRNYDAPGRWPANVLLTHTDDCVPLGAASRPSDGHWPTARPGGSEIAGASGHTGQSGLDERAARGETVEVWDCTPDCPVRLLDDQTGELTSGEPGTMRLGENRGASYGAESRPPGTPMVGYGDAGGASRFFYRAKTSRAERNAGLDGIGKTARNDHPTVKPIDVMRWLIRLVTPPGGVVLDPFLGSGTTGIAALLEGFSFVGIERDPEYMAICEARIRFWRDHGEDALRIVAERDAGERRRVEVSDAGQLDLFAV